MTATATGDVRLVVPVGFADEIVVAARDATRVHTSAPSAKVRFVQGSDLPAGEGSVRLASATGDVHVVEYRPGK